MPNKKYLKIDGYIIGNEQNISDEEFNKKFMQFIISNNWSFIGWANEEKEESEDVSTN
jgi:hypothetical protein